ncbi:9290_t:CDS:1, partial [Cetraspora pellucida]
IIADAIELKNKNNALNYAKKFYKDTIDTDLIKLGAYTYAKVLIQYEMQKKTKEMFKISFFE